MKNRFLLVVIMAACAVASQGFAQNCDQFAYMTNGKEIKYTATDKGGKVTTKMQYKVLSKVGNKTIVQTQVADAKGKAISKAEVEMMCDGNNLKLDMRSFMPTGGMAQMKNITVKADVSYLSYPANLKKGQKLDDGLFAMQMFNGAQKLSDITFKMLNRTVEATESITTPAGTFDCFKISYDIEMKTKTMGFSIPVNMKVTEWFSTKLGLFVKSEALDKNGRLMSTTLLDSVI